MKKFFAMALVALTAVVMASCSGSSSKYTPGGPEPAIDYNASTVNGIYYDDTTQKCWKVTSTYRVPIVGNVTDVEYSWATEFTIVVAMEGTMWSYAQIGYGNASYSYVAVPAADYESCDAKNDNR